MRSVLSQFGVAVRFSLVECVRDSDKLLERYCEKNDTAPIDIPVTSELSELQM